MNTINNTNENTMTITENLISIEVKDDLTSKFNNELKQVAVKSLEHNCYSKNIGVNNKVIKLLEAKKVDIWLNCDGNYAWRQCESATISVVIENKLKKIVKNLTKLKITIDDEGTELPANNLDSSLLHLVAKDNFNPFVNKEFYEENGETHRNLYRPTKYLLLEKNTLCTTPRVITSLLMNLVNNNEERYSYLINWLANYFQTLQRPPVAIILKGKQGTGKNLFVEHVLKPLLGASQVAVIGDKEIKKQFTGTLFEHKLFYILDEISHSYKDNYQLQNFLKQIIGSDKVFMEKKYQNTKEETKLYGPIMIFSNKGVPVAIESNITPPINNLKFS